MPRSESEKARRRIQRRRWKARRRYRDRGLTEAEYHELLATQDGLCAICRSEPGHYALAIDHDHATGVVRGLLCTNCNVGLGHFKDDPAVLQAALAYLLFHKPGVAPDVNGGFS